MASFRSGREQIVGILAASEVYKRVGAPRQFGLLGRVGSHERSA